MHTFFEKKVCKETLLRFASRRSVSVLSYPQGQNPLSKVRVAFAVPSKLNNEYLSSAFACLATQSLLPSVGQALD